MMIMLCQWDCSEQIEKLVSFYSVPARNVQKIPSLGTFCTWSVTEGLSWRIVKRKLCKGITIYFDFVYILSVLPMELFIFFSCKNGIWF
jgi:hypothetical protein